MSNNQNKIKNVGIVSLLVALSFLSVKFFKDSNAYASQVEKSESEIVLLEVQMEEILHKYDSLQINSKKDSELLYLNQDIRSLNDNINNQKINSVVNAKKNLTTRTSSETKVFKKPDGLSAININVKPVKIFSNVHKNEDSKIQQLRVCYTLTSNRFVDNGSKQIYIQVVNPRKQIISNDYLPLENELGNPLSYSGFSNVTFDNNDTDDCLYVNLEEAKTMKGKFIINIYSDFTKIGTGVFEYK